MSMMFCPFGPTSIMSMSSVKVWLKPFMSTVTFVTVPESPLTVTFAGYGEAGELSLMMIDVLFEKLLT